MFMDDADDKLIMTGIRGAFIYDFVYDSKYSPSLAAQIDKEGKYISIRIENLKMLEKIETMCLWVKGVKLDTKNELVATWNQSNLCFHHTDLEHKGKLMFWIKDFITPEVRITDLMVNMHYKYFCTGQSNGQIIVWKFENSKKQIHQFNGHVKEVSSLLQMKDDHQLFLSASLDATIRIWSLDKFQLIYTLFMPYSGLSFVRIFKEGKKILLCENKKIITNDIHAILQNYLIADSKIDHIECGFFTEEDKRNHDVGFTISLCVDNSAFIQRMGEKHKCTIYPPPSAQKIAKVQHSMTLDRIIILLTNCSLCVYKNNRETALLEKIMPQIEIKDSEDKPITIQQITSMEIFRVKNKSVIPPFDREILNENLHINSVGDVYGNPDEVQEYIALGMSKGSIYFLHVNKMN